MTLDLHAVGRTSTPVRRAWTEDDVMLYALAVGAGAQDPTQELAFTTENSHGSPLTVLPTFVNLLTGDEPPPLGDIDPGAVLHAEQSFALHRPLPPSGSARSTSTVSAIYDKGTAALVVVESVVVDDTTDETLATVRSALFIRGEGGFGGDRGPTAATAPPDRQSDVRIQAQTRPEQALLYRLTGDRNPLHSDPSQAARAGFEQPILHGMCTYGFTGRALLQAVCASEARRFKGMSGRFSAPVIPGEPLTVEIWLPPGPVHADRGTRQTLTGAFRTTSALRTVIDRGQFTYTQ